MFLELYSVSQDVLCIFKMALEHMGYCMMSAFWPPQPKPNLYNKSVTCWSEPHCHRAQPNMQNRAINNVLGWGRQNALQVSLSLVLPDILKTVWNNSMQCLKVSQYLKDSNLTTFLLTKLVTLKNHTERPLQTILWKAYCWHLFPLITKQMD